MTAARRRSREEALFTDALAQPADRRDAFLDRACHDAALRARIEALLRAHHEAGSPMDEASRQHLTPEAH
jgi:hypothetical protein